MSTRTILIFKDSYEYVGVYRHSDGYTEGVINDLEQFFKWSCRNDSSYVAANYIYFMKDKMSKWLIKEKIKNYPNNDYTQIGHGLINDVKNCIISDLEYVHVIDLFAENDIITVTSYKVLNESLDKSIAKYDISIKDDTLKVDQITRLNGNGEILSKKKSRVKIPYSSLFEGA